MADKLLTISIGVYNGELYIKQCLDSIVDSSVLEYLDIIVVNDGSKDNTSIIAHEYERKYPATIRVFDYSNHGQGFAYQQGIRFSLGKYIILMDADDVLSNTGIVSLIEKIKIMDVDLLCFNVREFCESIENIKNDKTFYESFEVQKEVLEKVKYDIDDFQGLISNAYIHNFAFNKRLFSENEIVVNAMIYADCILMTKIYEYANTVSFIDENIYLYRLSDVQATSLLGWYKYSDKLVDMVIEQISAYITLKSNDNISNQRINSIKKLTLSMLAHGYISALIGSDTFKQIKRLNSNIIKDNELNNEASFYVKIVRMNIPLFYPLLRAITINRLRRK